MNEKYIIHKVNDVKYISKLLNYFDDTFYPKLSKIVINIDEYAYKLHTYANVYAIFENKDNYIDNPIGFIAYYSNDIDAKIAYLTQLVVEKDHHKLGIGGKLMDVFISNVKNDGFNHIKLEVNKQNSSAINFYKKYGFNINSEATLTTWYMDKKL